MFNFFLVPNRFIQRPLLNLVSKIRKIFFFSVFSLQRPQIFAKFSMPYGYPYSYIYSFCQIFQALCLFPVYSGVHILVQVFLFLLWFSENDENSQILLFISKLKPSRFFIYSPEFFVAICTLSFICYGPLIALWFKIFLSTYISLKVKFVMNLLHTTVMRL